MAGASLRSDALTIWQAGVAAVDPYWLVRGAVREADFESAGRIVVVGAGKAGAGMARAIEEAVPVSDGVVNVPDAAVVPLPHIRLHGARSRSDNRPTAAGVEGARQILALAASLDPADLLICLLSGGGSALLPLPVEGVSLADKILVTALMQERGVPIDEMNAVRKHLSGIKGGWLAAATRARVLTLALSDVAGDDLSVLASGPTVPDPSTFADALGVIDRHGLRAAVPPAVLAHLERGVPETPSALPARVTNRIIGSNRTARTAAVEAARALGYEVVDRGEFYGATADLVAWLRDGPPGSISGGETTVALPEDHGRGGRNQQAALAMLAALGPAGLRDRCILCGGTDGEDGPTDAAGAIADELVAREATRLGLDPAEYLRRCDAYRFFDPTGGLLKTGLTGTNVMDLTVTLEEKR